MDRPPLPPQPDGRTGRRATVLLGAAVAGLVGAFVQPAGEAPVQPVALVRLLFTLPPLVTFGAVLSVRAFSPPLLAPMLALAMVGLTLWSAFETGLALYAPADPDDWLEVVFMGVTVTGLVGYLWGSQREGRRVTARAHEAASRDALTGLLNRAGLEAHYAGLGPDTPLVLAMLDLNGLKKLNDLGGHGSGDAHLKRVADGLAGLVPEPGAAARWGGDEFAVLWPGAEEAAVARALGRLDRALRSGDAPVYAVGLAGLRAGEPLGRTLALADARMYEAKAEQVAGDGLPADGRTVGFEAFAAELERLDTPEAVVGAAFTLARRDLGFDAARYFRSTPAGFVLAGQAGTLPDALAHPPEVGVGLGGTALERGLPVWAEDYGNHPQALARGVNAGVKSYLAVPVHDGGSAVGLLSLLKFGDWQAVTPAARRSVQAVALRLGHVLERERLLRELRGTLEGGFLGLGIALEARDLEAAGHTERVVALAERLGDALGLPTRTRDALRQGAYLHDIGKLAVPDPVLHKPGDLTPDERAVVQAHSVRGYEMACKMVGLEQATLAVVRHHHERWDGGGYPDGLVGPDIPLAARVFALCDAYDALTSARPYKPAWSTAEALAEIKAQRGRQFDPELTDAFLAVMGGSAVEVTASGEVSASTLVPAG